MEYSRAFLNELCRINPATFVERAFASVSPGRPYHHNWHIEVLAETMRLVKVGKFRRLIINLPPRHLKSITLSVAFPAWLLGLDPTRRIICASYGEDLAHTQARACRTVMTEPWYRRAFPQTVLSRSKSAVDDFETTNGGYRLSTSIGGTLTGRGGDILIIDDPIKPGDALSPARRQSVIDWFETTLLSRLDDKQHGAIIVVMQRTHVGDLSGYLLEKNRDLPSKDEWFHLSLPSIATEDEFFELPNGTEYRRKPGDVLDPVREPLKTLDQIRADMGSYHFAAQYQQSPVPDIGNLIKRDWFKSFDQVPEPKGSNDQILQSWDTAHTANANSDFSVCITAAKRGPDLYIIDVLREKLEFPDLKRRVLELQQKHNAKTVLIEDAGPATALIQQLRAETDLRPIAIKPEGSKQDRLIAQSSRIEAGQVYLPTKAPWLDEFILELAAFPLGRNDDQVDALSQLIQWATERCLEVPIILPYEALRPEGHSPWLWEQTTGLRP